MGDYAFNNIMQYGTYTDLFASVRQMAQEYGDMSADSMMKAWAQASAVNNPFIQNRRVKNISSFPVNYGKDKVAEMIKAPDGNEQPLRQVDHALEWTAYPFFKIRKSYQAMNTYRYYAYPAYLTDKEAESDVYEREALFVDKLNYAMKPDQWAHQIVGQVLQEGKVAYIPRISVERIHKNVNYAFLQQIPSDWWKIVGFNSVSKYTVMFNMMYFLTPGADWRQFGDLFEPYLDDFEKVLVPEYNAGIVYARRNTVRNAEGRSFIVDMAKFREIRENAAGSPQLYNQNGQWAYWVTLPVDKCWVFEADDAVRTVATPFTGLFLAMDQIAAYEGVQLEIVQNPLISVVLGEIPYAREQNLSPGTSDSYLLSEAGRRLFLYYWNEMLAGANTGGIGAYFAPVANLHLESLAEAPNATDISSKGYAYAVEKSGLSGLIPINDNPRAGAVTISAMLEERFCLCVYNQMQNMMNVIYKGLKLKFEWRFKMFGGFSTEAKLMENCIKGMERGFVADTYEYLALKGRSVIADIAMSRAIKASGALDLRLPLITSYSAQQEKSGLPPQGGPGRPSKGIDDAMTGDIGDGQEDDLDQMGDE